MPLRVTEWDDSPNGFVFMLQDSGYSAWYVIRDSDGSYFHMDSNFNPVQPPANEASQREIVVAEYMARHRDHFGECPACESTEHAEHHYSGSDLT